MLVKTPFVTYKSSVMSMFLLLNVNASATQLLLIDVNSEWAKLT